jgi:hypothetical protein
MEELKNILRELQSYKKLLNLNISDDMILDCSVRIFNSMNINKDRKETMPEKEDKITDKQKSMLKRLNYKGDCSVLTKKEASILIDEGLKEVNNGRGSKKKY